VYSRSNNNFVYPKISKTNQNDSSNPIHNRISNYFLEFLMNIFSSLILTYKRAFSGLPRNAWLLALVVFVNRSGSMVLFFLSLYLTSRKGFSVRETGQILSIYGAGALGGSYMGC
jgi:hypothetical protein